MLRKLVNISLDPWGTDFHKEDQTQGRFYHEELVWKKVGFEDGNKFTSQLHDEA